MGDEELRHAMGRECVGVILCNVSRLRNYPASFYLIIALLCKF